MVSHRARRMAFGLLALAVVTVAAAAATGDYAKLAAYKQGDSRKAWIAIEEQIRQASPAQRKEIEAGLLSVLEAPKATFDSRQYVCRLLRRIGGQRSVGALAKLLGDESLSHMARFALQHMPGEKAGEALREALGKLEGPLRIGVIDSLGRRGDGKAVAALARLAGGSDKETAAAAVSALGNLATAEAAKALAAARVPEGLEALRADAQLRCADALSARGEAPAAASVYRKLAEPSNPTMIRIAAFRGLALTEKDKAVPNLLALLKEKDRKLRRAAGKFLADVPGTAATKALAAALPSLSADAQMLVLTALTVRGDTAAA
ncbi:MAG TPA: HEAT repeat domain-containing protein, partial [Phycisphaerae bacterium]|nr:HEAT repeat domain-containing protein [Phycisphaerae bacterium]